MHYQQLLFYIQDIQLIKRKEEIAANDVCRSSLK
jgi:hypothetical protein